MKTTRATEEDINAAFILLLLLEAIERGTMPERMQLSDNSFDSENEKHCKSAIHTILDIMRLGSVGRVIWNADTLLDSKNKIVDQNSKTLEYSEELEKFFEDKNKPWHPIETAPIDRTIIKIRGGYYGCDVSPLEFHRAENKKESFVWYENGRFCNGNLYYLPTEWQEA